MSSEQLRAIAEQSRFRLRCVYAGVAYSVWAHAWCCLEIVGPAGTVFLQGDDAIWLATELEYADEIGDADEHRRAVDAVCSEYDSIAEPTTAAV